MRGRTCLRSFFLPIAAFELRIEKQKEQNLGRIHVCPPIYIWQQAPKKKAPTAFLPEMYRFLDPFSPEGRTRKFIDRRRSTTALE